MPGQKLGFDFTKPAGAEGSRRIRVRSRPHPVPFRARPIQPVGYDGRTRPGCAVAGGRPARVHPGAPDVLDLHRRRADRAGKDQRRARSRDPGRLHQQVPTADWVVKLIDVYPDEVAGSARSGRLSAGRGDGYFSRPLPREFCHEPKPLAARDQPLAYQICPARDVNHVFLPGHQASWCRCSRAGFRSTTATRRRICRTSSSPSRATTRRPRTPSTTRPGEASFIELPVVPGGA